MLTLNHLTYYLIRTACSLTTKKVILNINKRARYLKNKVIAISLMRKGLNKKNKALVNKYKIVIKF